MQPDLSNIKKKIKDKRDLIDRITTKVPGFGGFVEKAESYAADQIVRDFIADRIQNIKREISEISSRMSKDGNYDFLGELDSLSTNFERLYKKTKHADYGTSATTSNIKISDEDKDRLLEYDWRLISSTDEFDELIAKLKAASGDELKTAAAAVKDKITEFEKSFDDRKYVIMEVI